MKQQDDDSATPRGTSDSPGGLASFEDGLIVGLLIASGHLGGDRRQPQVTLRMHVRHAELLRWLARKIPGSRLYGPYNHGGRSYYQWMARGPVLRDHLEPLLERAPLGEIDPPTRERYAKMKERYEPTRPAR